MDKEIAERSKHYANRVKLPGFRPGKVPADVIRQRFRAAGARGRRGEAREQGRARRARGPRTASGGHAARHRAEDRREPAADVQGGVRDPAPRGPARLQGAAREDARSEGRRGGRRQGDRPAPRGGRPLRSRSRAGRRGKATSSSSTSPFTKEDGTQGQARRERPRRGRVEGQPQGPQRGARRPLARGHEGRLARLRRGPRAGEPARQDRGLQRHPQGREDEGGARRRRRVRQGPRGVRVAGRAARQDARPAHGGRAAQDRPRGQERPRRGPRAAGRVRGAGRARRAPHDGAHGERGPRPGPAGARPHQGRASTGRSTATRSARSR